MGPRDASRPIGALIGRCCLTMGQDTGPRDCVTDDVMPPTFCSESLVSGEAAVRWGKSKMAKAIIAGIALIGAASALYPAAASARQVQKRTVAEARFGRSRREAPAWGRNWCGAAATPRSATWSILARSAA